MLVSRYLLEFFRCHVSFLGGVAHNPVRPEVLVNVTLKDMKFAVPGLYEVIRSCLLFLTQPVAKL